MKKILTLILIIFNCLVLKAQWNQTSGLSNQKVRHIIENNAYLFAVTDTNKVYRSTDNGDGWILINQGLPYQWITDIEAKGSNLFVSILWGGSGTVYRSTDNGSNWATVNNGLTSNLITYLGSNSLYIFAATEGDGIFRSSNDGESWEQTNNGLSNLYTWDFAIDSSNIFVGTYYSGLFRSTDNGADWFSSGLSNLNIFKIGIHKSFQTSIFTNSVDATDTIYKSTDYGSNWTPIDIGVVSRVYDYLSFDDYLFIALGGGGVLLTTDAGVTWSNYNYGLLNTDVRALTKNNTYLFAGTYGSGIWRRLLSDITAIDRDNTLPTEYLLSQNFPNPFNLSTKIKYSVSHSSQVAVKVYDVLGTEIETLVNEEKPVGTYELTWNAEQLPSGIYFYQLGAGSYVETKKMVLMK